MSWCLKGLGEDHTSVRQDKPQGPGAGCACVPEDELGKKTGLTELLPETEEKKSHFLLLEDQGGNLGYLQRRHGVMQGENKKAQSST